MAQPVSFRWDDAFVASIDAARGDTKRSPFVRAAVEAHIAALKANAAKAAATGRPASEARTELTAGVASLNRAAAARREAALARQRKLNAAKGK